MKAHYLDNKLFEANIAKFKQSKQDKVKYELILEDLLLAQKRNATPERDEIISVKNEEYRILCIHYEDIEGQLINAFFKLAENIIRYRKYNFVEVEEAIQEFVIICMQKIDRFDPIKGKAFNYMTTCILNHYRQLYRGAKNYNEFKRKFGVHLQAKEPALVNHKNKGKSKISNNKDRFNT